MGQGRLLYHLGFTAMPEFEYQGRDVTGAFVGLLFRFFKNGREVLFEEGAEVEACDHVLCSFDKNKENCCRFRVKPYLVEDWFDKMEFEVVDWSLAVYAGTVREIFCGDFPEDFDDYPVSEGMPLEREKFVKVLREYSGNFENDANLCAECLQVEVVPAE